MRSQRKKPRGHSKFSAMKWKKQNQLNPINKSKEYSLNIPQTPPLLLSSSEPSMHSFFDESININNIKINYHLINLATCYLPCHRRRHVAYQYTEAYVDTRTWCYCREKVACSRALLNSSFCRPGPGKSLQHSCKWDRQR